MTSNVRQRLDYPKELAETRGASGDRSSLLSTKPIGQRSLLTTETRRRISASSSTISRVSTPCSMNAPSTSEISMIYRVKRWTQEDAYDDPYFGADTLAKARQASRFERIDAVMTELQAAFSALLRHPRRRSSNGRQRLDVTGSEQTTIVNEMLSPAPEALLATGVQYKSHVKFIYPVHNSKQDLQLTVVIFFLLAYLSYLQLALAVTCTTPAEKRKCYSGPHQPRKSQKSSHASTTTNTAPSSGPADSPVPLVSNSALDKDNSPPAPRFSELLTKFDPVTYDSCSEGTGYTDVYAVLRRDGHWHSHVKKGHVSEERFSDICTYKPRPNPRQSADSAHLDRDIWWWRCKFVRAFPDFASHFQSLNPYHGEPLLNKELNGELVADKEELHRLQLKVYGEFGNGTVEDAQRLLDDKSFHVLNPALETPESSTSNAITAAEGEETQNQAALVPAAVPVPAFTVTDDMRFMMYRTRKLRDFLLEPEYFHVFIWLMDIKYPGALDRIVRSLNISISDTAGAGLGERGARTADLYDRTLALATIANDRANFHLFIERMDSQYFGALNDIVSSMDMLELELESFPPLRSATPRTANTLIMARSPVSQAPQTHRLDPGLTAENISQVQPQSPDGIPGVNNIESMESGPTASTAIDGARTPPASDYPPLADELVGVKESMPTGPAHDVEQPDDWRVGM